MLLERLVPLDAIATGLSFGSQQRYFMIGTSRVFGHDVDPDLKLAFLGFFNKSLDVLVLSGMEYMSTVILVMWMIQEKLRGFSAASVVTFRDRGWGICMMRMRRRRWYVGL
jgi:hypothetical protein